MTNDMARVPIVGQRQLGLVSATAQAFVRCDCHAWLAFQAIGMPAKCGGCGTTWVMTGARLATTPQGVQCNIDFAVVNAEAPH